METWRVRLSEGDPTAAWNEFIQAYRALILATIRHTISDQDDVMEVFSHICGELSINNLARLTAFDKRSVHTAKFSSWLVVVVRHEVIDWLRKRYGRRVPKRVRAADPIIDESPLADQLLENNDLRAKLEEELERLKPDERLAIKLYLLEDLPAAEVARVLGWGSAKSVYNSVYRALATLRERLEQAGVDSTGF
ncbi:MAG TPA: sigma-70 family RNA polymerase sigma factor [Longimicrobiales bacterium]|nr:sigma-70 family RNA polymerase sigma factor [Longimicrobiales bacterium]